mmetsp:Transcript_7475/g.13546  ORF Transcript_7475/g.13546 Transcript_7475/m.13546 type:complete len:260 (-) Transcript_7475:5503-6282(-)
MNHRVLVLCDVEVLIGWEVSENAENKTRIQKMKPFPKKNDTESNPASNHRPGLSIDLEAQLDERTGGRSNVSTSGGSRVFNIFLRLLNSLGYKYGFNALMFCITVVECVLFCDATNNENIDIHVLHIICCVGIQITGSLTVLVLLVGWFAWRDSSKVSKACLLDAIVWIAASTLSVMSLHGPSKYTTAGIIPVLTLRFLSHQNLQQTALVYLGSQKANESSTFISILLQAYRPFTSQSHSCLGTSIELDAAMPHWVRWW